MKKKIDITKKVMGKITDFEKKRIRRFWLTVNAIILTLVILLIICVLVVCFILSGQHAFDSLELFLEDFDIIKMYWTEVIDVIIIQVPVEFYYLSGISLILFVLTFIFTGKRRRKNHMIEQQLEANSVTESVKPEVKPDADISGLNTPAGQSQKSKNNMVIPLVVFFVVILGLVWYLIFNLNKTGGQSTLNQPEKPSVSDTAVTPVVTDIVDKKAEDKTMPQEISLEIFSPRNGDTVTTPTIKVSGKTVAGAEVFIDTKETTADPQGNFSVTLTLEEDENYILVTAVNDNGNSSETELTVTYTPASSE